MFKAAMPKTSRLVLRLTILLSLLAAGTLFAPASGPSAGETSPLPPDLKTRRPNDVVLRRNSTDAGGADIIRFSNEILNRGAGPMEMQAQGDCDNDPGTNDAKAYQRVFQDANSNGVFDREKDTSSEYEAGCTHYHPEHRHWHFDDFARYELFGYDDDGSLGKLPVASSEKVGFCLVDTNHLKPALASSPASKYYQRCAKYAAMGISVGWSDAYRYDLWHQWIVITGVDNGKYCLRSTADPSNKLAESNDSNNSRAIKITLRTNRVEWEPRRPCLRGSGPRQAS